MALTEQQFAALPFLASGLTLTATAERLGVSRNTISSWINNDATFKLALRQIQSETLADIVRKNSALMTAATERLEALLSSPDERICLAACRLIFENGAQFRQQETGSRLAELESIVRDKLG
jgi:transposase-like protein